MFELNRQFSFIKNRKIYYLVSIAVILLGLMVGGIRGFNMGIDFTGGTMIQIDLGKQVAENQVQDILKSEKIEAEVVHAGENNEQVVIRTTQSLDNNARQALFGKFYDQFDITQESVLTVEQFGPSVGEMMTSNALKALAIATILMLLYIVVRFEWKFAVAAVACLVHDVLVMVSFYGLFHVPINNPFIAAILTIVGYSINDTIVVFDRIRENLKLMKKSKLDELIDTSINQTLIRSIMTSVTVIAVIIPLLILGGTTIRQFILPMLVGAVAGTLSTTFMASPLYYELCMLVDKPKYRGKRSKKDLE